MNITTAEWQDYDITVLDRRVAFSIPKNGNFYRQPKAFVSEVEERGFIYVYRVGYGFNQRTGYDAKIRINMQIKPFVNGPVDSTDLIALKQGIQDAGDAMSRRNGRPTVDRRSDYEDFAFDGREWGLLEYPNVSLIAMFTRFSPEHFVMLDLEMNKGVSPTDKEWIRLKQVLIDMASRVSIEPLTTVDSREN